MKYLVRITPIALDDAEEFYLWIFQDSPVNAANWFNGLSVTINALTLIPQRCPTALEQKAVVGLIVKRLPL